jgi:hypothetical protein
MRAVGRLLCAIRLALASSILIFHVFLYDRCP